MIAHQTSQEKKGDPGGQNLRVRRLIYFMSSTTKKIFLSVLVAWACLSAAAFYFLMMNAQAKPLPEITYAVALERTKNGDFSAMRVRRNTVEFTAKDSNTYFTYIGKDDAPVRALLDASERKGMTIKMDAASDGTIGLVLLNALPFLILIGFGVLLIAGFIFLIMNSMIKSAVRSALDSKAAEPLTK